MSYHPYLQAKIDPKNLVAVIGLISDTHMPLRRRSLPPNLGHVLGGVDLLLHAGDVGELWVLDQLSEIAPVIAVHGNDDTEDAQRELPYQQIITIAGQRILLWHSHFPGWVEEMESRKDDTLRPKLQRSIERAKRAGAKIVVFGHWHIPLLYQSDGVIVVNPGALASGNEFTRMLRNTVALLFIEQSSATHVVHVDLANTAVPYRPEIDWDAGFLVAMNQFSKSIIAPDLAPGIAYLRARLSREELWLIRPLVAEIAHPIWEQADDLLTVAAVDHLLHHADTLPADVQQHVLALWQQWKSSNQ
jgi:putative phosphoesterase